MTLFDGKTFALVRTARILTHALTNAAVQFTRGLTMSTATATATAAVPFAADVRRPLETAKRVCAEVTLRAVALAFPSAVPDGAAEIASKITVSTSADKANASGRRGEFALPAFVFSKTIKGAPPQTAAAIAQAISKLVATDTAAAATIQRAESVGPYINFTLTSSQLATVVPAVLSGAFTAPITADKAKVMIEYSQPNTHKAFHVGHMRNAALGDCLVRLYEQCGHTVIAANYYGDEGAHVAKCLWWLKRYMRAHPDFKLDAVPVSERGEWLGGFYSAAVEKLDLSSLTTMPYAYVIAAKVIAVDHHTHPQAKSNWRVVTLQISSDLTDQAMVVCGGAGYSVGQLVAYLPVGAKMKNKTVDRVDMLGVLSCGVMMAEKELGIEREMTADASTEIKEEKKEAKKSKGKPAAAAAAAAATKASSMSDSATQQIYVLPSDIPIGAVLTEFGRRADIDIPAERTVIDEYNERKAEVRQTLHAMESGDAAMVQLWHMTRQWSLDEFHRIYDWLGVRFDHEFFESEVSEPSKKLAQEYYQRGVFINSNGAVGADLSVFGLGFCMVLKSDGTGLYATKDLSLAQRKFDLFGVDQSIYVVDAAQTLHFKQVFKTLELMGYEQAKRCIHIPYGQVVLPSGKMSSRTGTVILFSQLRKLLDDDIYTKYFAKYDQTANGGREAAAVAVPAVDSSSFVKTERDTSPWSAEDIAAAQHCVAVATIKYGMLNHDTAKDIVFKMEEWTARSGNTGPYMLYAYARIRSIVRKVTSAAADDGDESIDFALLTHDTERYLLLLLSQYWIGVESCCARNNPSALCDFLFDLSKAFSTFYEVPTLNIKSAENKTLRNTRRALVEAVAAVIKNGLGLLGINTLERM